MEYNVYHETIISFCRHNDFDKYFIQNEDDKIVQQIDSTNKDVNEDVMNTIATFDKIFNNEMNHSANHVTVFIMAKRISVLRHHSKLHRKQ